MSLKFHLSKWKTDFLQFIDKFLTMELWGSGMGSRKIQTEGGEEGGLRIWNFQAYQYVKEIAYVISGG